MVLGLKTEPLIVHPPRELWNYYKKSTYIPAFLAAWTPEGASSNTRTFCGSTGPIYEIHKEEENIGLQTNFSKTHANSCALVWYYGYKYSFSDHLYLKSPGCSKKAVWSGLPLLHLWVIPPHYVMHQRKKLTVSLCFKIKMSCVCTALRKSKIRSQMPKTINPFPLSVIIYHKKWMC